MKNNKFGKAKAAIFLVVLIDLFGFSLILPLLPYYAESFGANEFVTGVLIASYALAQFIGAPILGRLSDRYGRKPILIASVFGTFLGFILMGYAQTLLILFIARVFDGLTGGNISVAQAYITDVTDKQERAKAMGMIGAAFGIGFIFGPVTGGFLSQYGYHVPALFAAALSLINLGMITFGLPESLPKEDRQFKTDAPKVNLAALMIALKRPFTGPLIIGRFMFGLAFSMFQTVFSLYALSRFQLDAVNVGYVLTYVGVLAVITQGFLVGKIVKRFEESTLITFFIGLMAISVLGWALANSVMTLLIVLTPLSISGGILNTLLSSTLTKTVEPKEVGGILGLSSSLESFTRVIAPIGGGWLLQSYSASAPGYFGTVILTLLFIFAVVRIYPMRIENPPFEAAPVLES